MPRLVLLHPNPGSVGRAGARGERWGAAPGSPALSGAAGRNEPNMSQQNTRLGWPPASTFIEGWRKETTSKATLKSLRTCRAGRRGEAGSRLRADLGLGLSHHPVMEMVLLSILWSLQTQVTEIKDLRSPQVDSQEQHHKNPAATASRPPSGPPRCSGRRRRAGCVSTEGWGAPPSSSASGTYPAVAFLFLLFLGCAARRP